MAVFAIKSLQLTHETRQEQRRASKISRAAWGGVWSYFWGHFYYVSNAYIR
jgi:hypothetical protein